MDRVSVQDPAKSAKKNLAEDITGTEARRRLEQGTMSTPQNFLSIQNQKDTDEIGSGLVPRLK